MHMHRTHLLSGCSQKLGLESCPGSERDLLVAYAVIDIHGCTNI